MPCSVTKPAACSQRSSWASVCFAYWISFRYFFCDVFTTRSKWLEITSKIKSHSTSPFKIDYTTLWGTFMALMIAGLTGLFILRSSFSDTNFSFKKPQHKVMYNIGVTRNFEIQKCTTQNSLNWLVLTSDDGTKTLSLGNSIMVAVLNAVLILIHRWGICIDYTD